MNPIILLDCSEALRQCASILRGAQTIVLTSHVNSDGDSLGSSLGLYHLLTQLGKTVHIVNPSAVPKSFRFLQGSEKIQVFDDSQHTALLASADVLVVLDANAPSRMRGMEAAIVGSPARKLVIDHHQEPQPFAEMYAVDTEACSTAELISRLVVLVGEEQFTRPLAECLYTGIMTDTGNFRFPRTTADVHRTIARLIEAGADPTYIYENVFNQNPLNRSILLGKALSDLRLYHDGKLCVMTVARAMMQETGANEDQIEGFVELTLGLEGVQMGALVVELADMVKISLRSKGEIPVNQIAKHFGGGGHINAAGCRTHQHSFQRAQELIVEFAKPYL